MSERDLGNKPYSPDEKRVAEFFFERGIGGGDDPIGFLMASYAYIMAEWNELRKPMTDNVKASELHDDR